MYPNNLKWRPGTELKNIHCDHGIDIIQNGYLLVINSIKKKKEVFSALE